MTKLALFGAGGKMGWRLGSNLKGSRFDVRHVELSPAGQERVKTGLKPGTILAALDAAAPFAGHLPERADPTAFVARAGHPPIVDNETDPAAKRDSFGSIAAEQHIVSAPMQGPHEHP